MRELVPKALDGWKEFGDSRLEDLAAELQSLKKLVGNRIGGSQPSVLARSSYSGFAAKDKSSSSGSSDFTAVSESGNLVAEARDTAPSMTIPKPESSTGRPGRAGIPSWQLGHSADEKSNSNPPTAKEDQSET